MYDSVIRVNLKFKAVARGPGPGPNLKLTQSTVPVIIGPVPP